MSLHLIIDGYNLIRQSKRLSALDQRDIELGRHGLLNLLVTYKKIRHHQITLVFDGRDAPAHYAAQDRYHGICIKFSRSPELADDVIKDLVEKERERAVVVTSDRDIMRFAHEKGAAAIPSVQFEEKLWEASQMEMDLDPYIVFREEEHEGWTPTTKKKGPSRKLSKKDRRNRIKFEKL